MNVAKRVLTVIGRLPSPWGCWPRCGSERSRAAEPAGERGGGIIYVNASRDDGLIAHWRFDDVGQTHTADTTRTQAHGPLSGNAQIEDTALPPGLLLPNSGALLLDGSGDYVDTADFDLSDDFTIALWASSDTPFTNQNMVGKHTASGGNLLNFGLYDGSYHLRIRGEFVNFNQSALPDWQHLTVTGERTGSSTLVRFYLNGNETQAVTLPAVVGDLAGRPWTIGQDRDGTSRTDSLMAGSTTCVYTTASCRRPKSASWRPVKTMTAHPGPTPIHPGACPRRGQRPGRNLRSPAASTPRPGRSIRPRSARLLSSSSRKSTSSAVSPAARLPSTSAIRSPT